MKKLAMIVTALLMGAFLMGCQHEMKPIDPAALSSKGYEAKVDNFLVIFDASTSMFMDYNKEMKFKQAKLMANNMNATIPADLDLKGGIRLYGPKPYSLNQADDLLYGMADYERAGYAKALASVPTTGGGTPLATAVRVAGKDLAETKGNVALIIISDAEEVGKTPVMEVEELKKQFGDRLCVYTILIGDNTVSRKIMSDMATAGGCGFATDYAALNSVPGMSDFVEKVFLQRKVVPAPVVPVDGDDDMDGVKNSVDRCPGTPRGVAVDQYGCPLPMKGKAVELRIEFDVDKYFIRPEYKQVLKDFANFMSAYPDMVVTIEGHTDSTGTDAYNQSLSEKRAKSVTDYLTAYFNVDPNRLVAKGFGESKPEADNGTDSGRQSNRRVMAVFSAK